MLKIYLQCHVYWIISHNRQEKGTAQVSISGWMEKANVVHIYDEYYLTLKTEKELHLHQQRRTRMCYAKRNKAATEGQMPHDLTCRIFKN